MQLFVVELLQLHVAVMLLSVFGRQQGTAAHVTHIAPKLAGLAVLANVLPQNLSGAALVGATKQPKGATLRMLFSPQQRKDGRTSVCFIRALLI